MGNMVLEKNFKGFIRLLNANSVKYFVVGGLAAVYHGYTRFFFLLIIFLLFNNCARSYIPIQYNSCDNTYLIVKNYKTSLSLNEMSQKLIKQGFNVTADTLYKKEGKWMSPELKILNCNIENKEISRIIFNVFEGQMHLHSFCLKQPITGTKKEMKAIKRLIEEGIKTEIIPLLKTN